MKNQIKKIKIKQPKQVNQMIVLTNPTQILRRIKLHDKDKITL